MIEFSVKLERQDFTLDATFAGSEPVIALFGPSGSGKTTILHLIAGLEQGGRGRIALDGTTFLDDAAGIFVPSYRRRIGLVFQDAQLFPHMTVSQNLRFGRAFASKEAELLSLDAVIGTLGLGHLMDRRTPRLSGGEKQRVALARALLAGPRLLLMDEPLSSLDDERRHEIMGLIERVRDAFRIPIIYVSHSESEVRRLANKVVYLRNGRVVEGASGPARTALKA